jgi:hypothetical protein
MFIGFILGFQVFLVLFGSPWADPNFSHVPAA